VRRRPLVRISYSVRLKAIEEVLNLAEKAALITGGSSGIGLAIARALGEDGYGITVAARRPDKLEQAAAGLREAGLDVHHVAANMREEEDIKRMVSEHRDRFGRMDVLVNNAGVGIGGPIEGYETKMLDMQLDVNLRAVHLTTRESIPMLKAAGAESGALIVNTASIAGKRPQGGLGPYSATKAAVIALSEAMQSELGGDGVRCTAICPALVDTPMTNWAKDQVASDEMIRPEDIAEIVRCLLRLSPAAVVPEVMIVRPADLVGGI
jgi:NAD(P)-dependent dehydrogenase (short-subunit alcohol dehydrogenase family)